MVSTVASGISGIGIEKKRGKEKKEKRKPPDERGEEERERERERKKLQLVLISKPIAASTPAYEELAAQAFAFALQLCLQPVQLLQNALAHRSPVSQRVLDVDDDDLEAFQGIPNLLRSQRRRVSGQLQGMRELPGVMGRGGVGGGGFQLLVGGGRERRMHLGCGCQRRGKGVALHHGGVDGWGLRHAVGSGGEVFQTAALAARHASVVVVQLRVVHGAGCGADESAGGAFPLFGSSAFVALAVEPDALLTHDAG